MKFHCKSAKIPIETAEAVKGASGSGFLKRGLVLFARFSRYERSPEDIGFYEKWLLFGLLEKLDRINFTYTSKFLALKLDRKSNFRIRTGNVEKYLESK